MMVWFQERLVKTTEIEKTTLDIEEAGVKLRLTIVDTPGYEPILFLYFQPGMKFIL